jgi:hypothetical protein
MKGLIKILIVIITFSFLNALIIYIKGSVRYSGASQEEIQLRYVNAPDFIQDFGISLALVSVLYIIFRILGYVIWQV